MLFDKLHEISTANAEGKEGMTREELSLIKTLEDKMLSQAKVGLFECYYRGTWNAYVSHHSIIRYFNKQGIKVDCLSEKTPDGWVMFHLKWDKKHIEPTKQAGVQWVGGWQHEGIVQE